MPCRHYFIEGRVQGVFFRASTQEQAQSLGLTGWVRNCVDGRVEAIACGQVQQLDTLELWLQEGPPLAKVVKLLRTDKDTDVLESGSDFKIR